MKPPARWVQRRSLTPADYNRWLVAGTRIGARYPCMCHRHQHRHCRTTRCDCWGRTDTDHLPTRCCARPTAPPTTEESRDA